MQLEIFGVDRGVAWGSHQLAALNLHVTDDLVCFCACLSATASATAGSSGSRTTAGPTASH